MNSRAIKINRLTERFFAHLFFFFFVFEIFSPQIGMRTIYIQYLFILLNPYFWFWIFSVSFNKHTLYSILPAIVLVPFHTIAAIKLIVVLVGVSFLVYAYYRGLFNIVKSYLLISIGFALVQFVATISGSLVLAQALGPTNLASMVWGPFATATNTNFYTIFFFPRVSGLSREAGFFASLLIASFIAFYINSRLENGRVEKKVSAASLLGYIVSFSKGSFAAIPAALIVKFRKFLNPVPLFLIGIAFVVVLIIFWHHFRIVLVLANSITYLSRFGGYALLYDMNVYQLVFGVSDLTKVTGSFAQFLANQQANARGFGRLAGLGGWCAKNGLFAFFLYTIGLQALGIRGAGFLIILLMTATVGIDTNQNFVLMSYYAAFMLSKLPQKSRRRDWRMRPALNQPDRAFR